MGTIKAIETRYKGYRFRSRLEARWAVFFDALGIPWEYEKEGFELLSGRYLPDFYLTEDKLWVEIKGPRPTEIEILLLKQLATMTRKHAFLFHGLPTEHPGIGFVIDRWEHFLGKQKSDDSDSTEEWNNVLIRKIHSHRDWFAGHCIMFGPTDCSDPAGQGILYVDDDDSVAQAAVAAKSARFEHSETR